MASRANAAVFSRFPGSVTLGVGVAVSLLAVAAFAADLRLGISVAGALADVIVGVVFALAAVLSRCATAQRVLVLSVGVSWLAASLVPVAFLHQAALAAALLLFPQGGPRNAGEWLLAVATVAPLLSGLAGQGLTALVFATVAGVALLDRAASSPARRFRAAGAASVAAVLGVSWSVQAWGSTAFRPDVALALYQAVLVGVSLAHVVTCAAIARRPREVLGSSLDEGSETSADARVASLRLLLQDALSDPTLRLYMWDAERREYLDESGRPPGTGDRWIPVHDESLPVAALGSETPFDYRVAVDDALAAVRSVTRSVRLQQEQERHLSELKAVRRRLLEAVDRQRAAVAARLRSEVIPTLTDAVDTLDRLAGTADAAQSGALGVARAELAGTSADVLGLVRGVPSVALGEGRIEAALHTLAATAAVPVEVRRLGDRVAAGTAIEAALYFVCSEALTNVAKHAHATRARVTLAGRDGNVDLHVSDDGIGGADPTGSGLSGLAERVAAFGGRLDVTSSQGEGTTVSASLPT